MLLDESPVPAIVRRQFGSFVATLQDLETRGFNADKFAVLMKELFSVRESAEIRQWQNCLALVKQNLSTGIMRAMQQAEVRYLAQISPCPSRFLSERPTPDFISANYSEFKAAGIRNAREVMYVGSGAAPFAAAWYSLFMKALELPLPCLDTLLTAGDATSVLSARRYMQAVVPGSQQGLPVRFELRDHDPKMVESARHFLAALALNDACSVECSSAGLKLRPSTDLVILASSIHGASALLQSLFTQAAQQERGLRILVRGAARNTVASVLFDTGEALRIPATILDRKISSMVVADNREAFHRLLNMD